MDEEDIQECVDTIMKEVRESDAFNTSIASKADTRAFLRGVMDECKSEIDAMGDEEDDEEE